jgi:hypothetical protein
LRALASLDLACRDHRPDFSATSTTVAFDDSSLQWLGISDLIAEPEGMWTDVARDTRPETDILASDELRASQPKLLVGVATELCRHGRGLPP